MILLVILPIISLAINLMFAYKFEDIAFKKGYDSSIHSFALCFWFGIIGFIYVAALPDLNNRNNTKKVEEVNSSEENFEITPDEEKYNKLIAKAEKFKDTFYDRDYRIRTYESIVKDMQVFADNNFKDSVVKLDEYRSYLEALKTKKIK
jgi:hypothetical protein